MTPFFPPRDDPPDPPPPRLQLDDNAAENPDEFEGEDGDENAEDLGSDENLDDKVPDEPPELSWEEELAAAGAPEDLITVTTYRFAHEAELAKLLLQREGVTAFIADAEAIAMDWFLGSAIGFVKLQVPRAQVKEAVTVLTSTPSSPPEEIPMDDDAPETARCLSCGATMGDNESTCAACGWSYHDDADSGEHGIQAV